MTRQQVDWLATSMRKQGWTEIRIEPSVADGYVVAYRRTRDEAHRYARQLSPDVKARFEREAGIRSEAADA